MSIQIKFGPQIRSENKAEVGLVRQEQVKNRYWQNEAVSKNNKIYSTSFQIDFYLSETKQKRIMKYD